jgi:hypothetical protein
MGTAFIEGTLTFVVGFMGFLDNLELVSKFSQDPNARFWRSG